MIFILMLLIFDVHFFQLQAEITLAKYPNRAYVYSIEGEFPMLFDVDGRGTEIFPTGAISCFLVLHVNLYNNGALLFFSFGGMFYSSQ